MLSYIPCMYISNIALNKRAHAYTIEIYNIQNIVACATFKYEKVHTRHVSYNVSFRAHTLLALFTKTFLPLNVHVHTHFFFREKLTQAMSRYSTQQEKCGFLYPLRDHHYHAYCCHLFRRWKFQSQLLKLHFCFP